MAKVTMPQLGESVAEGTIGKWLKQPGDHVAKYEPLLEVITDKVNAEVPSPFEGVLARDPGRGGRDRPQQRRDRGHRDGRRRRRRTATAATGPVVDVAAGTGARGSPDRAARTAPVAAGPAGSDDRGPRRDGRRRVGGTGRDARAAAPPANADPDARMTPAVRRLLREHDLSPAQIQGTGGGGRITREDVLGVVEAIRTGAGAARASPAAAPAAAPPAPAAPRARRDAAGRRADRVPRRAPTKSSCR